MSRRRILGMGALVAAGSVVLVAAVVLWPLTQFGEGIDRYAW